MPERSLVRLGIELPISLGPTNRPISVILGILAMYHHGIPPEEIARDVLLVSSLYAGDEYELDERDPGAWNVTVDEVRECIERYGQYAERTIHACGMFFAVIDEHLQSYDDDHPRPPDVEIVNGTPGPDGEL